MTHGPLLHKTYTTRGRPRLHRRMWVTSLYEAHIKYSRGCASVSRSRSLYRSTEMRKCRPGMVRTIKSLRNTEWFCGSAVKVSREHLFVLILRSRMTHKQLLGTSYFINITIQQSLNI